MEYLKINLRAFGEGDGGTGANAAAAGQTGPGDGQTAEGQVAAARDMEAEFDEMIKGDYREQYNRRVAETVQKRLKNTRETVDRYNKALPVFETLAKKYGVQDAQDIDAIREAMDKDDSYLEEEALSRGVPVEQVRVERERDALLADAKRRKYAEAATLQRNKWIEEANQTKRLFPQFDIDVELQNDQFKKMLMAGVDVTTAYKAIHSDELVVQVAQIASQRVAEKTANAVRANGMRPTENGSASQAAASSRFDPSKISKKEREELILRANRGERITFS